MGSMPDIRCGYFWGFASTSDNFMGILKEIRKTLFTALPLTLLYSGKLVVQSQMKLLANIMFSYLRTLNNRVFRPRFLFSLPN